MKKRNGFTLIELLAVIVILAIIALIAVPIILNIIGDAKSSSNERSIELYADAVEKSVATYQLNNNEKISGTFTTEDGKTLTSGTTTLKVDYKGKVVCETIEIYEDVLDIIYKEMTLHYPLDSEYMNTIKHKRDEIVDKVFPDNECRGKKMEIMMKKRRLADSIETLSMEMFELGQRSKLND